MKTLRLFLLSCIGLVLAVASLRAAPTSVEQWGLYEVALKGPSDGNPFTEVRLTATFTDGVKQILVQGFYDGDGVYRIRFMPETPGDWRYETKSNRWALTDKTGVFTVTPATGQNRGPVRVRNTYHFAYADGTAFKPMGTTMYSWTHRPVEMEELTLKTLSTAPFNKVRMLVFPQAHGVKFMPVTRWPFVGEPKKFDFTRFNPEFFQHLEKRIENLRDLGIECDLILFHPYDDDEEWGFETMTAQQDDFYLRYLVARLAAFRNIWWSIGNEYDFLRTKTEADWDRYFQVVQANDPYNHLRSIHNGHLLYDNNKPWVTHASVQNGMAAAESGRASLYRDVWRKPVVYDELNYEGSHDLRWAQLTGRDMVRNFWSATVAGTYGGHSEFFQDERQVVWLAQGGTLKGESAPRLAFLRKILADAPASGLDPIDQWRDTRLVGKAGEYYLLYFGEEKLTSWKPSLYRPGLTEGMEFQADVIDTWDMTITPVDGVLTLTKKDRYSFTDRDGREIKLPGKPYQAIRLRWVGGPKPQPVVRAPVEP